MELLREWLAAKASVRVEFVGLVIGVVILVLVATSTFFNWPIDTDYICSTADDYHCR